MMKDENILHIINNGKGNHGLPKIRNTMHATLSEAGDSMLFI